MEWRDEGLLLSVRKHGEGNAIIDVLTAEHGRHSGLVRGGAGSGLGPVLQPGAQLALDWRARLPEHLGNFQVEPLRSRAAPIMADRGRLAALNAMSALTSVTLPEREPNGAVFKACVELADALGEGAPDWPGDYARWEVGLLAALGFGLDLSRCAATGTRHDLIYVSPRTGRAVSRKAGGPWADRLLPLPGFLIGRGQLSIGAVREALRMTGHFLESWLMPALELKALPLARTRLITVLESLEIPPPRAPESPYNSDEAEWLAKSGSKTEIRISTTRRLNLA